MGETKCKHENWEVQGSNCIGDGHCNDCGEDIGLDILFNNLKKRTETLITRLETLLERNTK